MKGKLQIKTILILGIIITLFNGCKKVDLQGQLVLLAKTDIHMLAQLPLQCLRGHTPLHIITGI